MEVDMTADRELQERLLQALDDEPAVTPASIGVVVRDGVVTLIGRVGTLQERWAAERAVHHVPGLRALANDLEVCWQKKGQRTDAVIAEEVARALSWTKAVPLGAVTPTVAAGYVSLAGTVDHEQQRYVAERVARQIAGVKGIFNVITLREPTIPAPSVWPAYERVPIAH
jgi:osmotically-inducible protein OsmY